MVAVWEVFSLAFQATIYSSDAFPLTSGQTRPVTLRHHRASCVSRGLVHADAIRFVIITGYPVLIDHSNITAGHAPDYTSKVGNQTDATMLEYFQQVKYWNEVDFISISVTLSNWFDTALNTPWSPETGPLPWGLLLSFIWLDISSNPYHEFTRKIMLKLFRSYMIYWMIPWCTWAEKGCLVNNHKCHMHRLWVTFRKEMISYLEFTPLKLRR